MLHGHRLLDKEASKLHGHRLLDKEASKLPPRSGIKRDAAGFPISPPPEPKKAKRKKDDSDDESEAFRSRPTALVNRPMVTAPVERARKQAIELSMAQVLPSASFEERVAQFDHLEAVAKKRKKKKKTRPCVHAGVNHLQFVFPSGQ